MTAVVGNILTAAQWNSNVRDAINFLTGSPIFVGYQSAAQSIPNNAFTSVGLDTTAIDNYGGHSNTVNNSRYTAQIAGWYETIGQTSFASNATGNRASDITVNGGAPLPRPESEFGTDTNASSATIFQIAAPVFLNVGDFLELQALQSSGGALNTTTFSPCFLYARWVHQ